MEKEIRSSKTEFINDNNTVIGYALKFDQESNDLRGITEILDKNCIDDNIIKNSDVLCTYNHDENRILARSKNGLGTLKLTLDRTGLMYQFEIPDSPTGAELKENLKRGDLNQSSFAFTFADGGYKLERRGDKI